jgi:hypothetical protein
VGIGPNPLRVPFMTLGCSLQPFRAGILDLSHLRLGIQLILGINAFRGYRLQFDLAEGRLYLLS